MSALPAVRRGGRRLGPLDRQMADASFLQQVCGPTGTISTALFFDELPAPAALKLLLQERLLTIDAVRRTRCPRALAL